MVTIEWKRKRQCRLLPPLLALLPVQTSSFIAPLQTPIKPLHTSSSTLSLHLPLHNLQYQDSNTLPNLLQLYTTTLTTHPVQTKSLTAAVLATLGDSIAQYRSSTENYDIRRGMAFLLFGALYTGMFQHYWFDYLNVHIESWGDNLGLWGSHTPHTLAVDTTINGEWWRYFDIVSKMEHPSPQVLAMGKLFLNQFLVVPILYMPLFFAFTGCISGLDLNSSAARGRSLYFPILRRNYFFWLPVQFMQFWIVPVEFQVVFVSMASLVWTVILSSIGGGASSTSPSSIVVYETTEGVEEDVVTVSKVDPGPVNEITDDVLLQDVTNALLPDQLVETVTEVASNDVTRLTTGGLAAGLVAAAADEAIIGGAVGSLIGAGTGVGVVVVAAAGAGLGLLASQSMDEDGEEMGLNSTVVDDGFEKNQDVFYSNDR